MAASTITRATWTDDTGSAAAPAGDGTIISNTRLQNDVYAKIDELFAGAGAYATLTLGGKLAVEGFGTHNFSAGSAGGNVLAVRNTTAGAGNFSAVYVGNNTSATNLYLQSFSSTFTTSGPSVANGGSVVVEGVGGMSILASAGVIRFYSGGTTQRAQFDSSGRLLFDSGASGHVQVGTATFVGRGTTNPTNAVSLFNGTAPAGTLTNGVTLYCDTGELKVMDAAGNPTLLSPHDRETNEWIFLSMNARTQRWLKVHMERLVRDYDARFGTAFVQEWNQ